MDKVNDNDNEERIARLENSFVILTELARSADEWRDTHRDWISQLAQSQANLAEAQANTDVKIAALVDAQIRTERAQAETEVKFKALAAAQANSDAKIAALAGAQIRTEEHIAGLSITTSDLSTTMNALSTAMTTLAERMSELAEAQAHTDRRLDALIDIISQGRNRSENL
jgi:chromosome segregation ATPase